MSWLQVHLTIDKERAPLAELLLENLGAQSVTLKDAADLPLLEPLPGEMPLWNRVRLTGLFPETCDRELLSIAIKQAFAPDTIGSVEFEHLKEQVWERAWMDSFKPMAFGRRLWVCPTGEQPPEAGKTVVELDPGLAFGTGTHATTALCLRWLDAAELKGKHLIDYGCGSGILAIAALLLGAESVTAVDHDPQALQATKDNAEKNGVSDRLRVYSSSEVPDQMVDTLVANILSATIIELKSIFTQHIKKRGTIILSGVLHEQTDQVCSVYCKDFDMQPPLLLDDWRLLTGIRH